MDAEFLHSTMDGMPEEVVSAILEAHEAELCKLKFDHLVGQTIQRAGGRNEKAIRALLDFAAIGGDGRALEQAVGEIKQSCGYLFESPMPPAYAPGTGTAGRPAEEPQTLAGALRERFEKK